jgi:hypothetical protein
VYVATFGNNCESTYSVTINGSSPIAPTVSPNTAVCPGNSASITAGGGTSYTWYNGSSVLGTTASLSVTPGASTQYTCVVTSGACSATVYTTVTVNPLSNATFTFNDFCLGAANAATAIATPGGTFSFNPVPGDGATINASTGEISNEVLGATYSVQYAVAGTCPNTQVETVNVNSNDNASFTTANWCVGGTHSVTGIITPGGLFAFNPAVTDGATINSTTGVISNAVAGNTYTIQYTTPVSVCQASSTQTVTYNANPTVDAGTAQSVCQGQSVTLSGSGTATAYTWNNGVSNGVAFTPATVGTTVYTVTGTLNGCTATDVVNVTVNAGPTVDAGTSQTICNDGSQVTLTATGNATTYSWDNGVTDGAAFTPSVGTTTYTVTGTLSGCTSTDQVTVINNALPTVSLANFATACVNWDPFLLTGGTPAGGNYTGTNVSSNVFDPATAGVGTTTITYTYTDGNNCTNTAQNTITVDGCASIDEVASVVAAIYPNPTKGNLTIELKGNFEYEVLDTRGRLISMGNATDLLDLNITNYDNGVYMIKIKHDQFENSYRVIKQ